VASILASRSYPGRTSYAVSKGALLQVTHTLALERADQGITVNAVSPGPDLTEMTRPLVDQPDVFGGFRNRVPVKRFAEPAEIRQLELVHRMRHAEIGQMHRDKCEEDQRAVAGSGRCSTASIKSRANVAITASRSLMPPIAKNQDSRCAGPLDTRLGRAEVCQVAHVHVRVRGTSQSLAEQAQHLDS